MVARPREPEAPAEGRDPREEQDWFKRLPARVREEIVRDWRANEARYVELERHARRRVLHAIARMSALFAIADVACPETSLASFVTSLATGAVLGLAGERLDADRLVTGSVGLASFIALQWITRSGLSALHMLIFFPFGAMCAYLGYLREEPDWT